MTVTARKTTMGLADVTPDEAHHKEQIVFTGTELGTVEVAVYILAGKEYPAPAKAKTGSTTEATATVPDEWTKGNGQVYLKGSHDRRTNTVDLDILES
ncbi:hypothetical protein [Streptomyces celluloflavus]|uniref:hypothetical protein n=1 Tax=Streptomyces celluloflavus TaxID=58344 RepID=UPI00345F9E5B|nr:hypothetical protein OG717_22860 [Streptomyces celluloflavus]